MLSKVSLSMLLDDAELSSEHEDILHDEQPRQSSWISARCKSPAFHSYTKEFNVVYGLDCSLHIKDVCTTFSPRRALCPFALSPFSSPFLFLFFLIFLFPSYQDSHPTKLKKTSIRM